MPFEFKLPDLGEGIREAQVLEWRVAPGQTVKAFEPLCQVESAKAAVELTAPVSGKVLETRFSESDVAQVGDVLVVIQTEEQEPEWFGIVGAPPPPTKPAPPPKQTAETDERNRVRAAPFVRKLARERGIDLEAVSGSGPGGRVRIRDLEEDPAIYATAIPLRGLRKSIADHMLEAWRHAPQVTSMDFLDATELVRARDLLNASSEGARFSYLPLFVKASIEALRAVPEANARLDEARQAIVLEQAYHIGIATAVPGGLVVPVIRHADRLSLSEIAAEIERLVTAAREQRGQPSDQRGSTFTITSFGGLPGSPLFATPILNYPEVAILGLGRIDWQARVIDGSVVARQCIGASFTFDHRVMDGESSGRFMAVLRRYVEQPLELLLRLR